MKFDTQILGFLEKPNAALKKYSEQEYQDLINIHGKSNIDNDLIVECICLYPEQVIADAEGRPVVITEENLPKIVTASNKMLKDSLGHGLARLKSWMLKEIDTYDFISVQTDHNISIEKRIGFSNGKLFLKKKNDIPYLYVKLHIIDPDAKIKIKNGLWREVSAVIRLDDTIREISFVVDPALKQAAILSASKIPINNNLQLQKVQIENIKNEMKDKKAQLKKLESDNNSYMKEQNMNKYLDSLINCAKIYPRDRSYYLHSWAKLSNNDVLRAYNDLKLSQPVINLYATETRNKEFYKGIMMPQDTLQMALEKIKSGMVTAQELKSKATFAAGKKEDDSEDEPDESDESDDKEKAKLSSEVADHKDFLAKLSAKMDEGDHDCVKSMLSEKMKLSTEKDEDKLDDKGKLSTAMPKNNKEIKLIKKQIKTLENKYQEITDNILKVAESLPKTGA